MAEAALPSVSLIITTYNWPEALARVLDSVRWQTHLPDQVIIADDGSGEPTRELIQSYQADFPVPLLHSWQEDKGFRLSLNRNKAIAKASSDFIVMIDADMLLHPEFISDHVQFATPGYFTQGSRVILEEDISKQILDKAFVPKWWQSGLSNRLNALRLPFLSERFVGKELSDSGTRGCNMGFWRSDLETVNGFNSDFEGWGREDSEFVLRMFHAGICRRKLKFAGNAYHIYHPENSRQSLAENDALLEKTRTEKLVRCDNGLAQVTQESNHG